jgi:transposase-like protein
MNWSRGYKTYRNGLVAGFVPALDRLAVREISARYLSQDERIEIADLRHGGVSVRGIAERIGRSPSTISRELRRNGRKDGGYRRTPPGRWPPGPPPSQASADKHRAAAAGGRAAQAAVESAANRSASTRSLRGRARYALVSREHLPGDLPARLPTCASAEGGACAPFTAADRA